MVFYFSASGMQHQFNCRKSYTFWQVLPQISLSISFPSCLSTAYKNYFLLALILIEERTSSFLLSLPWIPKRNLTCYFQSTANKQAMVTQDSGSLVRLGTDLRNAIPFYFFGLNSCWMKSSISELHLHY